MLLLQLWTKEYQEGRRDHIKTAVRSNKCPSNNLLSKIVSLKTSLTDHSPKLLNHPDTCKCFEENRDYSQIAENANKCSLMSKISTSTSGHLWQSIPWSSCTNYNKKMLGRKRTALSFFLKAILFIRIPRIARPFFFRNGSVAEGCFCKSRKLNL